jgi:transcriptional regulator with XRE-family HTH domain
MNRWPRIGPQLRKLLKARGYVGSEGVQQFCWDHQYVRVNVDRWLKNQVTPPYETLIRLARDLKVTWPELFSESPLSSTPTEAPDLSKAPSRRRNLRRTLSAIGFLTLSMGGGSSRSWNPTDGAKPPRESLLSEAALGWLRFLYWYRVPRAAMVTA